MLWAVTIVCLGIPSRLPESGRLSITNDTHSVNVPGNRSARSRGPSPAFDWYVPVALVLRSASKEELSAALKVKDDARLASNVFPNHLGSLRRKAPLYPSGETYIQLFQLTRTHFCLKRPGYFKRLAAILARIGWAT